MNKYFIILGLLLGLASSEMMKRELVDLANISEAQQRSNAYYYYNYSWSYYVGSAIFICVFVLVLVARNRRNRQQQDLATLNARTAFIPQSNYVPTNQPYMSTTVLDQQYMNQQPYQSVLNVGAICALCNQPLGVQNMMDQVNSSTMILQCSHSFHYGCISYFMKTQTNCPTCQIIIQQNQFEKPTENGNAIPGEVPLIVD